MKIIKFLMPPLVLLVAIGIKAWLISTRDEPERFKPPVPVTNVDAVRLHRADYQVVLKTQGSVRPRTESTLIPQVSGRIEEIAASFREGGFFEKGDLLVRIESSDYLAALVVAEAALSQAELNLAEEEARVEQALKDWKQLGDGGEPGELVLRRPQFKEARASVASAHARLEQARRDLDRTRILAPYAGRILEKNVDIGQYVSPGTVLGRIYAVDYAEIRLPLTDEQLAYVNLPELYRGDAVYASKTGPAVKIKALFGGREYSWEGRIVRTEGAFDVRSRQLFVVAQVENPYGRQVAGRPPLKVGVFVEAEIEGQVLENVFAVPRAAVREGSGILLIDDANRLIRRRIDIVWKDSDYVIVRDGIEEGAVLCMSPVTYAVNGAPVLPTIEGEGLRDLDGPDRRGPGGRRSGDMANGGAAPRQLEKRPGPEKGKQPEASMPLETSSEAKENIKLPPADEEGGPS